MAQYEYQFLTEGSGSYINDLAAEAITKHALCYFDPTGNGWLLADADAAATMPVVGISMAAIPTTRKGRFLLKGFIGDAGWTWTPNGIIYASTTAGALTQTPPAGAGDTVQAVGIARTSTIIWFDPAGFGGVGSGQEFSPETAIVGFNGNLSSAPNYFLADGVADEVQINAAIAYVGALGGGSVFLERGTYTLAGTVTMNQDEVKLIGQGWDSVVTCPVNANTITLTGARCTIKDLQVAQTSIGNTVDTVSIGGANCILDNVYVSDADEEGITVNASDVMITNCYINGIDRFGILVTTNGDRAVISNNIIDTTGNDGIQIDAGGDNCIIEGNTILNWTGQPIDDNSTSSVVQGNNAGGDVLNSNGSGFATIQDAIDDLVNGGWVEVPERTFNEAVLMNQADVILRGRGWNSVINGGTVGHAVTISADRCKICDLTVSTTSAATNNYDGVNIVNGATQNRVINVYISSSDRHGVYALGENSIIENCYITNCDDHGIYVENTGDNSSILGNQIDTIGDDGVFLRSGSGNNIVQGNYIENWTNEAIDDDSGASSIGNDNWAGAGTYQTQAGGAWVVPTVTAGGAWEGRLIQVYNSNLGQYRSYVYLNGGWRYAALT